MKCVKSKRDTRSLDVQAQARLRRRAVAAVEAGRTQGEVAEVFGVSVRAVNGWMARRRREGQALFRAGARGRPRGESRLTASQRQRVIGLLRDRHPEQLKLPFYLWTREAVVQLLARRFRVRVSVWTAGRYLRAWGFTP